MAGACPPAMFFAVVTTVGWPKVIPVPVSPKDSGSGKTGWASPNTKPENQRFVGGTSPAASRVLGSGFTVRCTTPATSGSTCAAGKTVSGLRPAVEAFAPGAGPVPPSVQPVSASAATSTVVAMVTARRRRDRRPATERADVERQPFHARPI